MKKPKPSNKQRDAAISELFQHINNLRQQISFLATAFSGYLDWKGDSEDYRNYVHKKASKQQAAMQKEKSNDVPENDKVNEQNLETSTADQG